MTELKTFVPRAQKDAKEGKELSPCWLRFIALCKEIGWGRIEVRLKNGEPVMATILRQDIKLD